jgi:hypothetical protein
MILDQVEVAGRVSVAEVARPAAQIPVEVLHHIVNIEQQPLARRDFSDAFAGVLHRPA